jgi:hypothetical protein
VLNMVDLPLASVISGAKGAKAAAVALFPA